MCASATKSSMGRVLTRRKLKGRLSTIVSNESDPVILRRQILHLQSSEPDSPLIEDRINDALTICSQQIRIELRDGKASAERAAELMSAMDKTDISPAELDEMADRYIGAGNRVKGTPQVAALESELTDLKKRWGKDKTKDKYREDFLKKTDEGGLLNLTKDTRDTYPMLKAKFTSVAEPLGLSEAEYMAIASYSMGEFAYMNPAVANHKDKGKGDGWMKAANQVAADFETGGKGVAGTKASLYEEGALHAGMLQEGLEKLKANADIYREEDLFRGTRITEGELSKLKVGDSYPFENFTSLSTAEEVSRKFAGGYGSTVAADRTVSVLFKVRLKGWDIKDLSALGSENEMLVQPSQCTIVSIEDDTHRQPGTPPATKWKVVTLAESSKARK